MKRTPLKRGTKQLKRSGFKQKAPTTRKVAKTPLKRAKTASGGRPRAVKEKTKAQLKKELDVIFSRYIRHKYADDFDMVQCYTCSTKKPIKNIQNGHWIPRNNLATRFSEDNCRPQCVGCNMFQHGRPDVFAVNLIKEGIDIVELQKTRYAVFKVDIHWYRAKIQYYKDKVAEYESN